MKVEARPALTVQDVASELNVSRATVGRWIASGALRAFRLEGSAKQAIVRIRREDLERYLERCETVER